MNIGCFSQFGSFEGIASTNERYTSQIMYGLKQLGHEVVIFNNTVVEYQGENFHFMPRRDFDPDNFDKIILDLSWTEIAEEVNSEVCSDKIIGCILYMSDDNHLEGLKRYISALGGANEEFLKVPQYIPKSDIRIPFKRRIRRVFNATPAEDTDKSTKEFYIPMNKLREEGYDIITIGRQRYWREKLSDLYCNEVLERVNNYLHTWVDWKEYLFLLSTTGIYFRHSFYDVKMGIPEALAYGNIVILTRENSVELYDYEDVTLIEYNLVDRNVEDIQDRVQEIFKEVFKHQEHFARISEELSEKYLNRHSLMEVRHALRKGGF